MIVPYGASPGFSLQAEIREIAAHYGILPKSLRANDGRHSVFVRMARDALFWKLIARREISPARAAQLLGCDASTARRAAERHEQAIREWRRENLINGGQA